MINNIVLICDDFPSEGRPTFVFVEQLVKELAKHGENITVIAPQSLTRHYLRHVPLLPYSMVVDNNGSPYRVVRPYSLSLGNCPLWLNNLLEKFRYRGISNAIKKFCQKPDLIYGHFWHSAYVVRKYAYKYDIPMVVACGEGDNAIEDLVSVMSEKERTRFAKAVKAVVSVSSENKRRSINYGLTTESKVIVLPNSVDTSIFKKGPSRNIRRELGVADDDFLIAFTGAFIHRKGSDRLSKAVELLSDNHIKVMFIGSKLDGDDATPTCNGIVLQGRLEHSDVPQYLFAADCFCLPTLNEGCSNAIVEALACGLPVVSSNLPFNEDILDETNSILVNPMNVEEIASALKKIKESKAFRDKLAEGALLKASELRIDIRAEKIVDFITKKI